MANGKCSKLEKDVEFQVTYFGDTGEACLSWVPPSDYEKALTVILPRSGGDTAPGRYVLPSSDVVPGNFFLHDNKLYTVHDGRAWYSGSTHPKEVLQVAPECHVTLIDYTAGEDIPRGAVVGGHLSDEHGSDLYLIRGLVGNGNLHYGYYDPTNAEGYIESMGVNVLNEMEIMILLWVLDLQLLAGIAALWGILLT